MITDVVKVFAPSAFAFFVGIAITPILTHYLYKYRAWKKKPRSLGLDGKATPIFTGLHKEKEVGTPRMGGIVIWGSVLITTTTAYLIFFFLPDEVTAKLNFLSRNQTWLPFFTMMAASLIGLVDDLLVIRENDDTTSYVGGGLSLRLRILLVALIGLVVASWFYLKLDVSAIHVPFVGA
ncbi:hypothetical protein KW797_04300, partial [Candidatus Parcubacteria bacterium]|nr:hypothetical protein [Candidatus Parcubacteria bacterium]